MSAPERLIGIDTLKATATLLARHQFGKNITLVCDDLTWIAAAKSVNAAIGDAHQVTRYSLGYNVLPELTRAEELVKASAHVDGFIAVGSGTINDITKYAAAKLGKPYLCVATAASMNGYTSPNASLLVRDFKQSLTAKPPCAVLADLNIIVAAPLRLARSGLGDMLCRSTVEADMLLTHLLFGGPYPRALFDRMRAHETMLISNAARLMGRNVDYINTLMQALLDAGDAMTEYGSSAIASQGEHMIAHTAEMMSEGGLDKVRHGELVAIATLTMAALQEQILQTTPTVKPMPTLPSAFLRSFGQYNADIVMAAYKKKVLSEAGAAKINQKIAKDWPDIRRQIEEIMVPEATLKHALILAGVPTRPSDIKLDNEHYKHAVSHAYMSRERFGFLDLAAMAEKK